MAPRPIAMTGVIYPLNKMDPPIPCYIVGNAWDPSLDVGGGPIGPPPGVWPPAGVVSPPIYYPPEVWPPRPPGQGGVPTPPIYYPPEIWPRPPGQGGPPGIWGPTDPRPTPPIYWPGYPDLPPGPDGKPPEPPQPGDPTTPVPPPAGSPGWPTQGIAPPPFIVVNYPGIGPVIVAPPEAPPTAAPKK